VTCLWESAGTAQGAGAGPLTGSFLARDGTLDLEELRSGSTLGGRLEEARGRSVLLVTEEQLPTAAALLELDGVARRIVLCTPDLTPDSLAQVAAIAEADTLVHDSSALAGAPAVAALRRLPLTPRPLAPQGERRHGPDSEWILLTSGTTGAPKLVLHSLESLAGTLPRRPPPGSRWAWSTFYDIRRYGGMQIYLRAVLSGAPLVLSSAGEPAGDFLARVAAAGVTHISGTPSHWRRALMSGAARRIAPEYVRLSGEVADQAILDSLQAAYPQARVAHAFASTEAGVAFDVDDGRAGFPASLVAGDAAGGGVIDLKVRDGTLRIRSGRNAARYLGEGAAALVDDEGYVDTGDMVERVADRYYFRGRRTGVINVGGLKVHPEEVEAVLNADPRVRMSLVRGRRSPITGAVVVAEVVLADADPGAQADAVRGALLDACRRALPPRTSPRKSSAALSACLPHT